MALTPLNGFTTKAANFADKPNSSMSAAEVKAQFDAAPEELRVFVNSLITQLNADFALKSEIASALLGQILDGSLTDIKLSNATDQVKARLAKVITDLANFIATKGAANGLAPLDSTNKVPSANLPILTASGTWTDTSTTISASSTFTKTIPLGFNATRGRIIIYNTSTTSAIVHFTNNRINTIAYNLINTTSSFLSKNRDSAVSVYSFGSSIRILDCYISGSNLLIVFENSDTTTSNTLSVKEMTWEVEL